MKVIVPFTHLEPEVLDALWKTGYHWEERDVSSSDTAYFELIKELWDEGAGWINVEHDIVIRSGCIERAFEKCPHAWCVFPYPYKMMPQGFYAGLGFSKITSQVINRHPDVMAKVFEMHDEQHPR